MPNSLDTDGGKAAVAFGIKKNGYSFYHSNGSWSNHGIRDVKKKIFHTQDREDIFSLLFRSGNPGQIDAHNRGSDIFDCRIYLC